jgi:shikimate kinase
MVFLPDSDRNLILTGYTGPNQPAIGRQVAERLNLPFINVEAQIEDRSGSSIDEIKALFGESRLKTLESDVVHEAVLHRGAVIRISGQTLLHGDHLERLRATGPIICLVAALDAVLQRLHLALGARYHDPDERALALGNLKREWGARGREGVYELDATYMNTDQLVANVVSVWQELIAVGEVR